MVGECEICNTNERKYRCKICYLQYCSVTCYKKHQEQPCGPPPAAAPETAIREDGVPKKVILFSTIDTVPAEKLELLGQSEHLKNLLYNPHLRKLLTEIDNARDGMNALKVAMMEPLFVEFADECLRLVEPGVDESQYNMNELVFTNRQHRR